MSITKLHDPAMHINRGMYEMRNEMNELMEIIVPLAGDGSGVHKKTCMVLNLAG